MSALDRGWLLSAQADPTAQALPINLELVTVTDTEAAIIWFTCDPNQLDAFNRPTPAAVLGDVLLDLAWAANRRRRSAVGQENLTSEWAPDT